MIEIEMRREAQRRSLGQGSLRASLGLPTSKTEALADGSDGGHGRHVVALKDREAPSVRPGQQEEMASSMTTWVAPGSDGARSQGSLDLDVRISVWLQRYVHGSDGQMPPARRWRRDAGRPGCWQETEMAEDGGLTEMQVMAAAAVDRSRRRSIEAEAAAEAAAP